MPPDGLERLCGRLERCRRLLVVAGPELLAGAPRDAERAAQILGEMERYYEDFLLVAEAGHAAVQQACVRRWLSGDAPEAAEGSILPAFLLARPQLCLLLGADCSTPLAASAVAGAWRSCWIAELGAQPSELAVLARERHRGPALELLEELWERFLCGDAGPALRA